MTAQYVLTVKVCGDEASACKTLVYEFDKKGFTNAMNDVSNMYKYKNVFWTKYSEIINARFFIRENDKYSTVKRFVFYF